MKDAIISFKFPVTTLTLQLPNYALDFEKFVAEYHGVILPDFKTALCYLADRYGCYVSYKEEGSDRHPLTFNPHFWFLDPSATGILLSEKERASAFKRLEKKMKKSINDIKTFIDAAKIKPKKTAFAKFIRLFTEN